METKLRLLKEKARFLAQSKNWGEEAVQANNQIIDLDPKCAEAYTRLGKIYSDKGDHFAAMQMYEIVVEFEPDNMIAKKGLVRSKKIFGNSGINEALSKINSFQEVFSIAVKFKTAGDYLSAISAYRRALELIDDPDNVKMVRTGLAAAYSHSGVHVEAEKIYRELLVKYPHDRIVKTGLAGALNSIGDYQEAKKLCKEVLAEDPHNWFAVNCLESINSR